MIGRKRNGQGTREGRRVIKGGGDKPERKGEKITQKEKHNGTSTIVDDEQSET